MARSSWCPGTNPEQADAFARAVRLARRNRWSIFRIAEALGCSLSDVRRVIDPKAQAAHERWER